MHLRSVLTSPPQVLRLHIMSIVNILNDFLSDITHTRTQTFDIRHRLVSYYGTRIVQIMHLQSVLASPQQVFRFHIMPKVNILNTVTIFLISHKLDLRYLAFDIVWLTATRIAQIMHLQSVLALPHQVLRFHIMPKVNILNNYFSDIAQTRSQIFDI